MIPEPMPRRCVAFIDGQNLYFAAKEAFGYTWPNYDPKALAELVCMQKGWSLTRVFFYTGIPKRSQQPKWHDFWALKLAVLGKKGIRVFKRSLKYGGGRGPTEKGIDVRLALDIAKLAYRKEYDVALIFSQDQDLREAVGDAKAIAHEQNRTIEIASAFPFSLTTTNPRGIRGTDWITIDKTAYDSCIDPADYRPSGCMS